MSRMHVVTGNNGLDWTGLGCEIVPERMGYGPKGWIGCCLSRLTCSSPVYGVGLCMKLFSGAQELGNYSSVFGWLD